MVARVFGIVDGIEVALIQQGDTWIVEVPVDADGEYIVDIFAEDDVGNISRVAKALYIMGDEMPYATLITGKYYGLYFEKYSAELEEIHCCHDYEKYFGEIIDDRYYMELLQFGMEEHETSKL